MFRGETRRERDRMQQVNGWMNRGEKGCLWTGESVAARLINEALARGPEKDQQLWYRDTRS